MSTHPMPTQRFFLKVNQIDQTCLFQLTWGKGQALQAKLSYPPTLVNLYTNWHTLYSQFYGNLRGRVDESGMGNVPPTDWRVKLAQAEVLLLNEFYFWLSDAALLPIRSSIAQATQASGDQSVDVFLTCDTIELERLPWESWEIGTEFAATQAIQVTRSPVNIRQPAVVGDRQGRTRILAILGDDTGLNFQAEIDTLNALDQHKVADVRFVGWQNQPNQPDLKTEICQALVDEQGWDVLFFAGHSNETTLSHGEIHIAPGQSILLKELIPHLKKAQKQGLQVAIFNSCSGLSIAQGLIDLGFRQVVVMREPIHNQVAQEFFLQFVKRLANYEDIHTAVRSACQYLRLEKSLTFPSAYLVPSLYRHPDAPLFQARPIGTRAKLRRWLPTRLEAIGLIGLIFLTGSLRTQQQLINQRQWIQAIYRDLTGQAGKQTVPPVLMVQIDEESIKKNRITPVKPINKAYLGQLLNQAQDIKAPIVGLDYLLDRPQSGTDREFSQKVQQLINQGAWLTVATSRRIDGKWSQLDDSVVSDRLTLYSEMDLRIHPNLPAFYAPLRYPGQDFLPLSYQLALASQVAPKIHDRLMPRRLDSPNSFTVDLQEAVKPGTAFDETQVMPKQAQPSPVTALSYRLQQMWLHPIIDYSIPPGQVYQKIPAWQFLQLDPGSIEFQNIQQQVLFIVPGLYSEAGVNTDGEDHCIMPEALRYRSRDSPKQLMPGGEVHAYLVHHWLKRSLITPIPDLWMILLAALSSKALLLYYPRLLDSKKGYLGLGAGLLGGSWLSLQSYVGLQILLPWLSPTATICFYLFTPIVRKQWYARKN